MKFKPVYFLLLLYFLLQLPFLTTDPDTEVDIHTRGAWTDEGLYASQARNYVHYGDFGMRENTTFVRGPLQTLLQVVVFRVFGTSLPVARLMTLMSVCLALFILASYRKWETFAVFLVSLAFVQFQVFNFSHYSMAEMIAVAAMLVSFIFLSKYYETNKKKHLFFAALMVFISWGLKIQFLYLLVVPPAVVVFYSIILLKQGKISVKQLANDVIIITGFSLIFILLYAVLWYLPNKEFYDYIMVDQTTRRFEIWEKMYGLVHFNFNYFILKPEKFPLVIATALALIIWIFSLFTSRIKIKNHLIVIFGLVWLLVELHKLGMTYLPQRYLLSLYVAAGFFSSALLFQFFRGNRIVQIFLMVAILVSFVYNSSFNYDAYGRRTYEIKTANDYLLKYDWHNKTIAGVWAPSLTWKTSARVIPVWSGYADPQTFFKSYHPPLIIGEDDDDASDNFFIGNGFDLDNMSDSVRYFHTWRYQLKFFWMKNQTVNSIEE